MQNLLMQMNEHVKIMQNLFMQIRVQIRINKFRINNHRTNFFSHKFLPLS